MLSRFKTLAVKTLAVLFATIPATAFADDLNGANTAWILTATALVLFMTIPGLSLFYGGLVRSKNVLSVLMQCFAVTCLASIIWFAVGYSMAFGMAAQPTGLSVDWTTYSSAMFLKAQWLAIFLNQYLLCSR